MDTRHGIHKQQHDKERAATFWTADDPHSDVKADLAKQVVQDRTGDVGGAKDILVPHIEEDEEDAHEAHSDEISRLGDG